MKFNLNTELYDRVSDDIRVGDVFPAKGGRGGAVYWVVIGVSGDWKSVKVLGLDKEGEVVSATGYNARSLTDRPKVGFVKGLTDLEFDIEPV